LARPPGLGNPGKRKPPEIHLAPGARNGLAPRTLAFGKPLGFNPLWIWKAPGFPGPGKEKPGFFGLERKERLPGHPGKPRVHPFSRVLSLIPRVSG